MLPLFLIVFIDLIGFGIIVPLLPYYAKTFGAPPAEISLLFAMYSIGQFLASPFWGRLSDRYGRKPILLVSLAGSVVGYAALGMTMSLPMLAATRLFAGLMAGNISTAMAYIADVTGPENRAKGMGMIGAAFGLGFIFGPVIGGVFAGPDAAHADFVTPSFLSAGLSAIAFTGVAVFLRESLSPEKRAELRAHPRRGRLAAAKAVLAHPGLRQLIPTLFLTTTAMALMETSFTIWINSRFGWGPRQVGYTFAFIGLIMAAIQGGGIGRLVGRFGEMKLLLTGAILLAAGLVALTLSYSIPAMLIATALEAIGYGLAQPVFNSLISKQSGGLGAGLVMGVSQSAASLARIAGPLLSSAGFAFAGLNGPFLTGAAIMLPVMLLIHRIARGDARRTGTPQPG